MAENDHKHHVPAPEDIPTIQEIRQATIEYEKLIDKYANDPRSAAVAKTNLETARMWAIAAIVKPRPVAKD